MTYVEARYRTLAARGSRAIAGHSMGGFGALSLAMERPELYGAVAAIAPGWPNDFSLPPTPIDAFVAENPEVLGTPIALDITRETAELLPVASLVFATSFSTNALYSMAAAFSPNPANAPYYVDLPVGYPGKTLVADVWEKWVAKDLVHQIAERGARLAARLAGALPTAADPASWGAVKKAALE